MSTINTLTKEQLELLNLNLTEIQKLLNDDDFLTNEDAMSYATILKNVSDMLFLHKRQLDDWKEFRYSLMKTRKLDTISLIAKL
jgi:hypothetical protein